MTRGPTICSGVPGRKSAGGDGRPSDGPRATNLSAQRSATAAIVSDGFTPSDADARGPVTRRSIGPLALGMTEARAREVLGPPRASGRGFARWCTLRAAFARGRIVSLRTSSPIYRFHGIRPGSRVRWRGGTHRIGRGLTVGVRGHRVRWLACARAS